MIAATLIRRIEHLLRASVSQRRIALETGVSRDTIQKVHRGELTSAGRERIETIHETPDKLDEKVRCPNCGADCIEVPCRRCFTTKMIAAGRLPATSPEDLPPVGLELRPEHEARFAEIREKRRKRGRRA